MELDFTSNYEEFENFEEIYTQLIKKTFKHLKLKFDPIISVSLVDNTFIHEMNRDYRGIDRPTDVISFAFLDNEDRESLYKSKEPVCLGDIYISVDQAKEQAEEYGHSARREFAFLAVHGYLHLCGYDHQTKEEEKVMFDLQEKILEGANVKR